MSNCLFDLGPMTNVLLTDLGLNIPLSFIDKCVSTSVDSTIYWQYTFETSHLPPLLLDRVPCQAKRCKLRKLINRMGYTYIYSKHNEMQTRLKWVSALYIFCENEAHIKHPCTCTRITPLCQVILWWTETNGKPHCWENAIVVLVL